MSKLIFDDENIIFVNDHLSHFISKRKSFGISNDNELCRLFTFTFPKVIERWFNSLPAKFIHY